MDTVQIEANYCETVMDGMIKLLGNTQWTPSQLKNFDRIAKRYVAAVDNGGTL